MSPRSLNVIVTGASGLLGRAVYQYLTDAEFRAKYPLDKEADGTSVDQEFTWNCLGLCYSRSKGNLRKCDLTNLQEVDQLIDEFKPDAILHCAAERRVENVENNFEKAMQLNKGTTEHLAETCAKRGILFVYISTDYVFDGSKPPYTENAETNPLNKYGLSKLSGEQVTLKASENHCVVRVTVLYGYTEPNRSDESAVNMLIEKTKKLEPFKVDNFQVRFPVHTIDVARFLTQLMRKRFKNSDNSSPVVKGILHCRGDESFTKYQMASIMADLYNLSKDHILADMSEANKTKPHLRPDNPLLDTTHSYSLLNYRPILSFRTSIKDCLENFVV